MQKGVAMSWDVAEWTKLLVRTRSATKSLKGRCCWLTGCQPAWRSLQPIKMIFVFSATLLFQWIPIGDKKTPPSEKAGFIIIISRNTSHPPPSRIVTSAEEWSTQTLLSIPEFRRVFCCVSVTFTQFILTDSFSLIFPLVFLSLSHTQSFSYFSFLALKENAENLSLFLYTIHNFLFFWSDLEMRNENFFPKWRKIKVIMTVIVMFLFVWHKKKLSFAFPILILRDILPQPLQWWMIEGNGMIHI